MKNKKINFLVLNAFLSLACFGYCYEVYETSGTISVEECLQIASKNYKPLDIVNKEMKFYKSKLNKSTRDLFPEASLTYEGSTGEEEKELQTPEFEDKSFGLQVSQVLFQGGKIFNTRRQSKANYEISKIKIMSTRKDMEYGVKEAYFNLVKAMLSLKKYKENLNSMENYFNMSKKLMQANAISQKELLSVESNYNQAIYKMETANIDFQKMLWKWTEAMGLSKTLDRLPDVSFECENSDFDLDKCLILAESNNYENIIQNLASKAAKYNLKVQKAQNFPKIELGGFYGRSGGAYKGEDLKLKEDYQIGVTVSQYFFGNVLTGSSSRLRTSPKLGESTRTKSDSNSGSLEIFSSWDTKINKKEALIAYEKALLEQEKTRIKIANDVREAFSNWQKSRLQINATEAELKLSKINFDMLNINFSESRSSLSEVASAKTKVVETEVSVNESKVFYILSVENIKRLINN